MIVKIYRWLIQPLYSVILLALFSMLAPLSPVVLADGGAPNLAYVAGTAKGVSVIDVAQQKITSTINVPSDANMILLSLDGRYLYATEAQQGRVAVIAAKTGELLCTADVPGKPSLLAADVISGTFFAAGNGAASVSQIDPGNCSIKHTFATSGPVYGMYVAAVASSLSPDTGNQLWIANGNQLSIFDDLKYTQIGSITIAGGPGYVTIPPGATVYTTTRDGNVVAVDLNSHKLLTLISGSKYGPMDYDASTGEIYVPDLQNNQLVVLAPVNAGFAPPPEPSRTIKIGVQPRSIAITNDGALGFVALQGGNVAMIDIPSRQTITTFFVGGEPQFIITGLYPPPVGTTPQQTSTWQIVVSIMGYLFVIVLLIVPLFLYRRYIKKTRQAEG